MCPYALFFASPVTFIVHYLIISSLKAISLSCSACSIIVDVSHSLLLIRNIPSLVVSPHLSVEDEQCYLKITILSKPVKEHQNALIHV